MQKIEFLRAIGLSFDEAEFCLSARYETDLMRLFAEDRQLFFHSIRQQGDWQKKCLSIFIDLAYANATRYRALGLSRKFFIENNLDIALWLHDYRQKSGEIGVEEIEWLAKTVDMRIFRLGRLQFELLPLDRKLCVGGRCFEEDDLAINMHVPAGKPLDFHACSASVQESFVFFHGITPLYLCSSWLCNPTLIGLVKPGGNIEKFCRRFSAIETYHDSRQAEERVFGKVSEDAAAYPEDTSLQRHLKRYLLNGKRLGETLGAFVFDDRKFAFE